MKRSLGFRLEEGLLALLIILSFAEFFDVLPGDLDFIKKLVSWTTLGYLLYRASITKLFLGDTHRGIDLGLILAYFLFFIKDVVAIAITQEARLLSPLYSFIASNALVLEEAGFIIGGILLILFSIYLTFNLHVRKPSIMHVVHEQGLPSTLRKKVERFFILFIVFSAFFILVFNLMMEWLAVAVDASLMVFTILFFFIAVLRKHKTRFDIDSLIFRVVEGSENFYEKFIALFHSKKRIYLGFSGLLVLHLLTDTAVFIVPYLLIFTDKTLYVDLAARMSLGALMFADMIGKGLLTKLGVGLIYMLNVIAMVLLLVIPGYIWWKVYRKAGFKVKGWELSLFFASLVVFLLAPVFRVSSIRSQGFIGVDIVTHSLQPVMSISMIIAIAVLTAAIVYIFSSMLREELLIMALAILTIFFSVYVYHFFVSTSGYFLRSISHLWQVGSYFAVFYFALFLIITTLFYAGGLLIFLLETKREYRYIR